MKTSSISVAAAALAGFAFASPVPGPTSVPISLKVQAPNTEFDGKFLGACHSGAATETVCISDKAVTFDFNTTAGATSPLTGYNPPGTLSFVLPVQGAPGGKINEPLSLGFDATTNLAVASFTPGYDTQTLAVSKDGEFGIFASIQKGESKPSGKTTFLSNWYICTTYVGYEATTLNWLVGEGEPFNPTCEKVKVFNASYLQ